MADRKTHMTFEIGVLFMGFAAENARFLAHPTDGEGNPLPDQPSAEKSAELERDAEAFERWGPFYAKVAEAL